MESFFEFIAGVGTGVAAVVGFLGRRRSRASQVRELQDILAALPEAHQQREPLQKRIDALLGESLAGRRDINAVAAGLFALLIAALMWVSVNLGDWPVLDTVMAGAVTMFGILIAYKGWTTRN